MAELRKVSILPIFLYFLPLLFPTLSGDCYEAPHSIAQS